MLGGVEFLLILALLHNGWQLNQIRKVSKACYMELNTARWEAGKLERAKDQGKSLTTVGRHA